MAATAQAADGEYVAGLTFGAVHDEDPGASLDLDGARVAFTAISRGAKHAFVGEFYAEWKQSRRQEVVEAGAAMTFPYLEAGRVAGGPRLRLGLRDRDARPDRGSEGVVALGVGFDLRLAERAHLVLLADRSVGFESGTGNSASLNLRLLLWDDP